jgi:hypothetical protein
MNIDARDKIDQPIKLKDSDTHHRHLIDIARRICPTVRVHELE